MKFIKPFFAICLSVLAVTSLHAQTGKMITLEQAIEQTFSLNRKMAVDRYAEQVQLYERKAAKGLRSPQFGITAGYTYMSEDIGFDLNGLKPQVQGIMGSLPVQIIPPEVAKALFGKDWRLNLQDKDFAVIGASVKVPIFMGGKINAANRAAQIELELSREASDKNKSALQSELIERYYGVALAMQAVTLREEVVKAMEKHLADAVKLEANGIVPKVERLYAQMNLDEAKVGLGKARATLSTISSALRNTLNEDNNFENIVPLTSMFVLSKLDNVNYFKEYAVQNNSILKEIKLKGDLAKEGVKVERAAYMPEIAAIGGIDVYNYQLTSMAPRWAVGAALKFNIFDGLHRENSVRAAKSKVQQVEAVGESARADISTLIEKLYNELQSTKEVYDSFESSIAFAEEYLRIKEIAFNEGMAPSKDVVDANLLLLKNRMERLQTAFNYDVNLAKILENCGMSHLFLSYKNSDSFIPVYYEKNEK